MMFGVVMCESTAMKRYANVLGSLVGNPSPFIRQENITDQYVFGATAVQSLAIKPYLNKFVCLL